MSIKEYFEDRLEKFGIVSMSDSDLLDICDKMKLDADRNAKDYPVETRERAFLQYIPEFLLFVDSIDENGFRTSRNDSKNKIQSYYSFKCKELGVEDRLNEKSRIRNATNRW